MKTTRKVLSFIIALAFILSAFPMPVAFAEGEEYEEICVNDKFVINANDESKNIYKFVPKEDGVYAFYSFDTEIDIYCEIYDSRFNEIKGDDDGGDGVNFYVSFNAKAGKTYYLASASWDSYFTGKYSVSLIQLVKATEIKLPYMSYNCEILDSFEMIATFAPKNAIVETINWSISDESVAEFRYVEDDYAGINIVGVGTAIVTAKTSSGLVATCLITATEPEEITVETGDIVSYEEGQIEKTYKFVPEESGIYRVSMSDDTDRFGYTVRLADDLENSEYSRLGEFELTANKTYYITTSFWNYEASPTEEFEVTIQKCTQAETMTLSQTSITKMATEGEVLEVVFGPYGCASEELTWKSSNTRVAQILWTEYNQAEVWVVGSGTATITVTSESGLTATCVVTGKGATTIKAETEVSMSVSGNEGTQLYKFVPSKTGIYTIYSLESNFTSSQVILYDSSLEWLDLSDYSGDSFSFAMSVTKGKTYYIRVRANSDSETATAKLRLDPQIAATGFSFMQETFNVNKYEELYCTFQFEPINAKTEWVELSSSNPEVVKEEYGNLLFVGVGVATITATSESGLKAYCTIVVSEPPQITEGVEITVKEEDSTNIKCFRFVPEKTGMYSFESMGASNTYCELYDSEFNMIEENDQDGYANNYLMDCYLEEGQVYYFRTQIESSLSEEYTFIVKEVSEGDVNNDGQVNIFDYQQVVNFALSSPEIIKEKNGETQWSMADINNDGAVDALDAWKLSLIINGK